MKKERRRVRSLALQALYEIDCVDHPPEEVVARYLEENENLGEDAAEFFRTLVLRTFEVKDELDRIIAESAPEWPIEELAIIDRSILRLSLWELVSMDSTPMKVTINEAVELAKRYGSDSAARFVNGVLGTLATNQKDLRFQLSQIRQGNH